MDHFGEGRHLLPRTLLFVFSRKCSQYPLGFSMYLLPPFRRKDEKQILYTQNKWPLMSSKICWEAEGERTVLKWYVEGVFWKEGRKNLELQLLMIYFRDGKEKVIVLSSLCKTVWMSSLLFLLHPSSVHQQFLVPTFLFSYLLLLPITSYSQASAATYQVYHCLLNSR